MKQASTLNLLLYSLQKETGITPQITENQLLNNCQTFNRTLFIEKIVRLPVSGHIHRCKVSDLLHYLKIETNETTSQTSIVYF